MLLFLQGSMGTYLQEKVKEIRDMNRIYRECNKCYKLHEVRYHLYKDNTEHLVCICPDYGYTTLKYEKDLEIPYYKTSKRKVRHQLNGLLDVLENTN